MNKIFSKKMVATLIAGVLIVTVAVAGISAWFTGTAEMEASNFETATVAVESTGTDAWVNNFYPGDTKTILAQGELEAVFLATNQTLRNAALKTWWNNHNDNGGGVGSNFYIVSDANPYENAPNGSIKFVVAPSVLNGNKAENVTPGSFIYSVYKFKNTSSIPVYLRVAKPKINVEEDAVVHAAFISWQEGSETLMVDGLDGFYYCPVPLEAVDNPEEVKIHFTAYFAGGKNGNELQNTTISFADVEKGVEVIQATNNAVYMASGWKNVANLGIVKFVPYTV